MPFDAEVTTKSRDLIVLEKARERIARGWCTLEREDAHGNVCLRGALAVGRGINPNNTVLGEQGSLARLLGFHGDDRMAEFQAMAWNDVHTQAEVLARFDAAIERLSRA